MFAPSRRCARPRPCTRTKPVGGQPAHAPADACPGPPSGLARSRRGVIENKAGGGIGTTEIARAKPDGYTIGSGQVGGGMPEEFDKFIQDERAKWAEVIKEVNISVEK